MNKFIRLTAYIIYDVSYILYSEATLLLLASYKLTFESLFAAE